MVVRATASPRLASRPARPDAQAPTVVVFTIQPTGGQAGSQFQKLRLWISYTPNGGTERDLGIYGLS
jgi:hypothetical protein